MSSRLQITKLMLAIVAFELGFEILIDLVTQYQYKDEFKITSAQMNIFLGVSKIPWILQPLWGILIDSYSIFNSKRKSYLIILGVIGGGCWILMSLFNDVNVYLFLFLIVIDNACLCISHIVGVAMVMEYKNLDHPGNILAYFFICQILGGVAGSYLSGFLINNLTKSQIYLLRSILPSLIAILALLSKEPPTVDKKLSLKQILKTFQEYIQKSQVLLQINHLIRSVLAIFISKSAPTCVSIFFYFFIDVLKLNPDDMGLLKLFECIGNLTGVLVFKFLLKELKFADSFPIGIVINSFSDLCRIVLVQRFNINLNITDYIFCLEDAFSQNFAFQLVQMPIVVYTCQICPKNVEAAFFSALMGICRLGAFIGTQTGTLMVYFMGITENDFSKLWIFVLCSGIYLLIPIPIVRYTINKPKIMAIEEEQQEEQLILN